MIRQKSKFQEDFESFSDLKKNLKLALCESISRELAKSTWTCYVFMCQTEWSYNFGHYYYFRKSVFYHNGLENYT